MYEIKNSMNKKENKLGVKKITNNDYGAENIYKQNSTSLKKINYIENKYKKEIKPPIQFVSKDDYYGADLMKFNTVKKLVSDSRSGYSGKDLDRIFKEVTYSNMNIILSWSNDFISLLNWNIYALEILKNPNRFSNNKIINDAEDERSARTNCAIVVVGSMAGKERTSDVTLKKDQDCEFFVRFLIEKYPRLEHVDETSDVLMDMQALGMVAWLYEDQGFYPEGWDKKKVDKAIDNMKDKIEPEVNFPRSISDAEEYMKKFRVGTKFSIQCTGAGGIQPHWLIAYNWGNRIQYFDYQANRSFDREDSSSEKISSGGVDDRSQMSSRESLPDFEFQMGSQEYSDSKKSLHDESIHASRMDRWAEEGKLGKKEEFLTPNKEKEILRIKYSEMNSPRIYDKPVWFRDDTRSGELIATLADSIITIVPQKQK